MKKMLSCAAILALCLSVAFPVPVSGQDAAVKPGETIEMTGSFLEPLQKRD